MPRKLLVALLALSALILFGQWQVNDFGVGYDLHCFQKAGELVHAGISPYNFTEDNSSICREHSPSTYPPVWAFVAVPLSFLPFWLARGIWTLLLFIALVGLVRISYREFLAAFTKKQGRTSGLLLGVALTVLALAMTPVWGNFTLSQVSLLIVALTVFDLNLKPNSRYYRMRGVLVGVATAIKLTPALIILHWIITKQFQRAGRALAAIGVLWTTAALVWPADSKIYFTEVIWEGGLRVGDPGRKDNFSLYGVFVKAFNGIRDSGIEQILLWGTTAISAITILLLARMIHNRGDAYAASIFVGLGTVLVSPISWYHHAIWIVPALGALVKSGVDRVRLLLGFLFGVLACNSNIFADYFGPLSRYIWPAYLIALLIVLMAGSLIGRKQMLMYGRANVSLE